MPSRGSESGAPPRPASVLFVCMGNICRSPAGEAVLRRAIEDAGLGDRVLVDSAGTIDYHTGDPPDERMREAGARRRYVVGGRARQVTPEDLVRFDLVIAMDRENLRDLRALEGGTEANIELLCDFLPPRRGRGPDVPDPYFGGERGFEQVLDLIEEACPRILERLLAPSRPEPADG